jgi:hypothetical protein
MFANILGFIFFAVVYFTLFHLTLRALPHALRKPFRVLTSFAWFVLAAYWRMPILAIIYAIMTIVDVTAKPIPRPTVDG